MDYYLISWKNNWMYDFRTFLIIVIIASFLGSCKTTEQVPPRPEEPGQALNPIPPNMVVWKEEFYTELNTSDSLRFYNNDSIILRGTVTSPNVIKNGKLVIKSHNVVRVIKPYTPGRPVKIIRDEFGTIIGMVIWYDQMDESFKIWYTMENFARWEEGEKKKKNPNANIVLNPINDPYSFILNGAAKIFFNGLESDVTAKSKNSFGTDDRLMFEAESIGDEDFKVATGRNGGSVTNTENEPVDFGLKKESGTKIQNKAPYAPK